MFLPWKEKSEDKKEEKENEKKKEKSEWKKKNVFEAVIGTLWSHYSTITTDYYYVP